MNGPGDSAQPGSDYAQPGSGDEVGSDCEVVSQWAFCPAGGQACEGTVTVEATAKGGTSAAASARTKKGRKVILGKGRLYVPAGSSTLVGVSLRRKNLTRVLRGRQRVSAQSVVRLEGGKKGKKSQVALQAKKKKSRVIGRTRFVFTKG